MDSKFQRPDKSRLTNAQYFSFMTAFGEQLTAAAFTDPDPDPSDNPGGMDEN